MSADWIVLSDLHEHTAHLRHLAAAIRDAALVVLAGDLTMFGGQREAARVVDDVRALNPRVVAVPGNTDHRPVLDYLEAERSSLHARSVEIDGVALYGVGGSNPTPFGTPFELSEDQIGAHLAAAHDSIRDVRVRVLVSHAPPFESGVDRLWTGRPVGSRAVRAHVERTQPSLVLSGHIHEARGVGSVGSVPVLNPGPFVAGGFVRIQFDAGQPRATFERIRLDRGERVVGEVGQVARKLRRLPRMR